MTEKAIGVRFKSKTRERIKSYAEKKGITETEAVRLIVENWSNTLEAFT